MAANSDIHSRDNLLVRLGAGIGGQQLRRFFGQCQAQGTKAQAVPQIAERHQQLCAQVTWRPAIHIGFARIIKLLMKADQRFVPGGIDIVAELGAPDDLRDAIPVLDPFFLP